MSDVDYSPSEELGSFFDTIWKNTVGFIYLPTLDRKTEIFKPTMYEWPKHREWAIKHVVSKNALGLDVYVSPAIYKKGEDGKPRPIKENVLGSWFCWTDYDDSEPREWAPESTTVGTEALNAPVPAPTMRIESGTDNHVHAYWELSKFSDVTFVENTNRSIAYSTRGDIHCWNINHILRPPTTRNHKNAVSTPVSMVHQSKITYSQSRFSLLPPVQQLVSDSIDTDNLPTIEWCIAKYKWDEDFFKMFMDPKIANDRSGALMRVGYICAEMGMSDREMYAILDNADRRWKKYVTRPDRRARLLEILNRARVKHPTALNTTFNGLLGKVEQDTQLVYNWNEFLTADIHVEWAVDGFLQKAGYGMVTSAPGVGKTQFSLQFAIACALGEPFLEYVPSKPMRITIFSLEMPHMDLLVFLENMAHHYDERQQKLLTDNLSIVPVGETMPLENPEAKALFRSIIEQTKPDGIIIDSLVKCSMMPIEEKSMKIINNEIDYVRKHFDCFVWMVHHNRKPNGDNKRPTDLSDIYGSTFITAAATTVILLYKEAPNHKDIEVYSVKTRLTPMQDMFKINRDEHLFFTRTNATSLAPVGGGLLGNITKEDQRKDDDGTANLGM